MAFQDWMLDKRVLKRNIHNGTISRQEYKKYLDGLPDMKDNIAEEEEEEEAAEEKAADPESSEEN